jgi:serine phosphatase RsbU (regulator of sigma subunit)
VIEFQNSQIVESINYSKQIQASLLPSVSVMQKSLANLFVLFEPKAIVSGDFYWFKDFDKYTILACVDCTGHGVPGGFMSTLGSLLLDKVINSDRLNPSEILSNLSDEIISVLHQQAGGAIQDGMDLSICLIDKEHHTVEFAGARNGIIIVTNGVAKKYKADLYPVGGSYLKKGKEIDRVFKTQKIVLEKNDWIYMYTDGFMEQSGGEHNLPMNYNQFENHLITISNYLSPEEKINKLKLELDAWRGANERDDDVLVMGFQIS